MKKQIAILAGDGIGPEVMIQAQRVLEKVAEKYSLAYEYKIAAIGGDAYEKFGIHFPIETQQICQRADAILFGSVGGPVHEAHLPKWQGCETNSILALRKNLNLGVNIRPIKIYRSLVERSPLKNERLENVDFVVIRELTGDIYFGEHQRYVQNKVAFASDVARYDERQIATAAHAAFKLAQKRKCKVTSVDKANVLATSQLWREVVTTVAKDYPNVIIEHMLVDNCALQLFLKPAQFDVILTANLFGDILSDAAAGIPGSVGLIPSASFNANNIGLYEPSGGSAPDIAGKNIANPIAQILSVAMMLRLSFDENKAADQIEQAINITLAAGFYTQDITNSQGIGTHEFTDAVISRI